jgi:exosortase
MGSRRDRRGGPDLKAPPPVRTASRGVVLGVLAALWAPAVVRMAEVWWTDPYAGHGMFVLLFSAIVAWLERKRLQQLSNGGDRAGLVAVSAGIGMLGLGYLSQSLLLQGLSLVGAVGGVVRWMFGAPVLRAAAFPVGFLALMVPLPRALVDATTLKVQLFAAGFAAGALRHLNVPVYQTGIMIEMPTMSLQVAETCNGLRFLAALVVLTAAFAQVTQRTVGRKALLIALAPPIAVLANAVRVAVIALGVQYWGPEAASGVIHHSIGKAVWAMTIIPLAGFGIWLARGSESNATAPAFRGSPGWRRRPPLSMLPRRRRHVNEPTILYVALKAPFPLDWGTAIRQFHLLQAYARVGAVSLVAFYKNPRELSELDALKPFCASVHPVSFDTTHGRTTRRAESRWRQTVAYATTVRPFFADYYLSGAMRALLEQLSGSTDLIHVARLHMMSQVEPMLDRSASPVLVLDLDDVETVCDRRMLSAQQLTTRAKLASLLDLIRVKVYQRKAIRNFDHVLVCSREDRARLADPRVVVVPNGASIPDHPLPDNMDTKTILFISTLSYWPNVDALFFFLREIFPLVRQAVPSVRLLIVGKDPSAEILRLHDGVTIRVAPNVPNVEPLYREATISVVPLRAGGGTRLKILEAFALGRPVVSTTIGAEGLEAAAGEHLAIADEPRAFARACVELLTQPRLRAGLAVRARALVEQRYAWSSIEREFAHLIRTLIEERRTG